MSEVFDVYPNSSRSQNCLDRGYYFFSGLTESCDDIHREWDREDLSDSFDGRHEFITTNHLAIRVAERYHESCAGGCNRWESFILKDACARKFQCFRRNRNRFPWVNPRKYLTFFFMDRILNFRR